MSVLEKDLNPDVKIGISLPMDHINGSGFFPGTSTTLTQTSSNIRNLLLTNKGERVGQPEFGCGLLQVLFEPMSDDLLESVRSEIEESIAFWLPHVTINNISVEVILASHCHQVPHVGIPHIDPEESAINVTIAPIGAIAIMRYAASFTLHIR